jgi:O-antigen/teichoic acid export membrane protein
MSIRRNTTYNLIGAVVPLAASLAIVPIYLSLIGEARYGVLALVWLLLGYFGLFDLGLGRSVAQNVAALRDAPPNERAKSFWAALVINLALGSIGGILIYPLATFFFNDIISMEADLRTELVAAVPWLMLAVPVSTVSSVLIGALQGRERFLELNVIAVIGTLLAQTFPLAAALFLDTSLALLVPAALCARLIGIFLLIPICRRHIFGGYQPTFDSARARQLLRFGGWVTVSAIIGPLTVALDRFAIGMLSGVRSVSHYTIPADMAARSTLVSGALVSALFPRLATSSVDESHRLAAEGTKVLLMVMTPLTIMAVLFVKPFLALWITLAFAAHSGLPGQILLLGFWANALAMVPYTQLQAKGRPDLIAKYHLAELFPYFLLLYAGLSSFGLPGAAAVFALRMLVALFYLAAAAGSFFQTLRLMALPSVIVLTAFALAIQFDGQMLPLTGIAATYAVVIATWIWRDAPPQLRAALSIQFQPFAIGKRH